MKRQTSSPSQSGKRPPDNIPDWITKIAALIAAIAAVLTALGAFWQYVYLPNLTIHATQTAEARIYAYSTPTISATLLRSATIAANATAQTATPSVLPSTNPARETSTPTPMVANIEMVTVADGAFSMGSSVFGNDHDYAPAHAVFVSEFFIDKFDATNVQYSKCVVAGTCTPPKAVGSNTRPHYFDNPIYRNYPVVDVTWQEAKDYCGWRGARLPTEAEWEKAASWVPGTNTSRLYPWGDQSPNSDLANYYNADTSAVDKFPGGSSAVGAYDMAGNVLQWVSDYYDAKYYGNSPARNPIGPASSAMGNVARGGAWSSNSPSKLWTFQRYYFLPGIFRNDIGFRCASDIAPVN